MNALRWIMLLGLLTLGSCGKKKAKCKVRPNSAESGLSDDVRGTVTLTQNSGGDDVEVYINVQGFDTSDGNVDHGVHIHEDAISGRDCSTGGSHYNPDGSTHGSPNDDPSDRHVGDLGNFRENNDGTFDISIEYSYISLRGTYNIIGRSFVIHQSEDTLDESVDSSGGAGARIACCTIEEVEDNSAHAPAVSLATIIAALVLL